MIGRKTKLATWRILKMEIPKFAEKLGPGRWIGTAYVLNMCPICSGKDTMKFTGRGLWGCSSCHKGGVNLASLRKFFADDPMMSSYVSSIIDPEKPSEIVVVSEYINPYQKTIIGTGFGQLDHLIGGLTEGALSILTGKRGEGKSCFLGQLALNVVQTGHCVCFYSGELSTGRFQSWLFSQAAGTKYLRAIKDQFGTERFLVSKEIEGMIRNWLGEKLVLYDNTKAKSSERRTIIKCFNKARAYYGSDLFIVDNLMTARYDIDDDRDSLRAQANFVSEMMDFARTNNVHVIVVAHPRKDDSGDINDSVAGLGDITNMATNVIQVKRPRNAAKSIGNNDAIITVSKNREYGDTGEIHLTFDNKCKRFIPKNGTCILIYDWENDNTS